MRPRDSASAVSVFWPYEEVGGDGFLISDTPIERRSIMEICDGLVPELQRRGLTRKAYAHKHLRDNLLEF